MQYTRLYRCSLVTMMTYMACSLLALKPPTQILARFEHKSRNEYDLCCQRTLMFLLFLKRNFPPLFSLDSSISAVRSVEQRRPRWQRPHVTQAPEVRLLLLLPPFFFFSRLHLAFFFGWNCCSRVFRLTRENSIQQPPVKVKEYPLHEIKLSFTSSDVRRRGPLVSTEKVNDRHFLFY